ncbi:neutral zinc metallopeptidase [Kribbella sp. NPDC056345]|uniref:neutral zinc metallopeptidase n=1 Tax=Kribbella sp. NPDC056345 TaxID=3345789 RepID=UPI0035DAC158
MSNQHYGPPPQQYGGPPGPPQQQYWGPPQGPPPGQPPYGGPPPGPGFGFGGNGYPPPRKKRSKAPFIIVPAVLLFAGVVSLYLFALHAKQERRNNYSSSQPTYGSTTQTPAPEWNPSSNRPTATRPTRPVATRPTPTKSTPPPPSDVDLTARNRIYKTGVQKSVNCRAPALPYTSEPNARKNYAAVIACLNRAWPAQVRASGANWGQNVKMTSYVGTGFSPCGSMVQRSFYCGSNRTIYMDAKTDIENWRKYTNSPQGRNWVRGRAIHVTAHEFGHHLQKITGILSAQNRLQYDLNRAKALEMNRRMEIQASCFGNVFMGANRRTMISAGVRKELIWMAKNSGDEYDVVRDHGSREIQPYWADRGYNSRNPAFCNTFTASPQYVR